MINKDSLFLDRVLADDLVYIHSNGQQDTKQSLMKNILNGTLQYLSVEVQQADIRTHSQDAWIHGVAKIKVRNGQDTQEMELNLRYLDIYKKEDGEWKLVAWQSARLN
jgi:ketosteroid isomerase-like protein